MNKTYKHIIFFDEDCGLCHQSVRHILAIDQKRIFCFSPLNGEHAKKVLSNQWSYLQTINSLVLIENIHSHPKYWIYSKAVFRIYWLLQGKWKILGIVSFFPSFLGDKIYRFVAKHRHQLCLQKSSKISEEIGKDRFLP